MFLAEFRFPSSRIGFRSRKGLSEHIAENIIHVVADSVAPLITIGCDVKTRPFRFRGKIIFNGATSTLFRVPSIEAMSYSSGPSSFPEHKISLLKLSRKWNWLRVRLRCRKTFYESGLGDLG